MAWARLFVACALSAFGVGPARAQELGATAPPALVVEADAEACVTRAALEPRVARVLQLRERVARDLEVRVHAGESPVRFEVRRSRAVVAERRFEVLPAGCDARLDALALAVALAIEHAERELADGPDAPPGDAAAPGAVAQPDARAEGQQAQGEQPGAVPTERPAPGEGEGEGERDAGDQDEAGSRPAPSAPIKLTVAVLAGGDFLLEALPEPAFALHAGAELALGRTLALSLAALFAPSSSIALDPGSANAQLLGGRALACLGTPGAVRVEACAGTAAGAVVARGEGVSEPQTTTVAWVAGVVRAGLRVPVTGPLSARAALDGTLNLVRPGLRVNAEPAVTRTSAAFGGGASLELIIALP